MRKTTAIYLLGLHLLLILMLFKSDFIDRVKHRLAPTVEEISEHYRTMVSFHQRIDPNLPPGTAVFIGDSHIQGLATAAISPRSVNYGIGGDTTVGILQRLPFYSSLQSAAFVVIAVGHNDLRFRSDMDIAANMERILKQLPSDTPIILCAIPPVAKDRFPDKNTHQRIVNVNKSLKLIASSSNRVTYLDAFSGATNSQTVSSFHRDDGIHLNADGYAIWIDAIIEVLKGKGIDYGTD